MKQIIAIACGGALGAMARYGISKYILLINRTSFPWGTTVANFVGLFLVGFFFELFEKYIISPNVRNFLFIGFLGALTTFSTYGLETIHLFRNKEVFLGLGNILLSNFIGLVFVLFGVFLARLAVP